MSSVMKILLVGAELFREDTQTEMAKLIVALRKSVKVPVKDRAQLNLAAEVYYMLTLFGVLSFIESVRPSVRPLSVRPYPHNYKLYSSHILIWGLVTAISCSVKAMCVTSTVCLIMYAIWSSVRLSERHLSP
jgi:hypothetical protein